MMEQLDAQKLLIELDALRKQVAHHNELLAAGKAITRVQHKDRIFELVQVNPKVDVSTIAAELKIHHKSYILSLMREAAEEKGLEFVKGTTGVESFVCRKLENRLMTAIAEIEHHAAGKPTGTSYRVSGIMRGFNLDAREADAVIHYLAQTWKFRVRGKPGDLDRRLVKVR